MTKLYRISHHITSLTGTKSSYQLLRMDML